MKKIISNFLPAVVLFVIVFYSCGKDSPTVVNGTVVDKYTGEPIDSVLIEFLITHKPDINGFENIESIYVYSDKEGKFFLKTICLLEFLPWERLGM